MQKITFFRRAERRHTLRGLGINADMTRVFASQAQALGLDAALLALPFAPNPAGEEPLQDPVTGMPLYFVGISAVGGADPIGGEL